MSETYIVMAFQEAESRGKVFGYALDASDGLFTLKSNDLSNVHQFETLDQVHAYLSGFEDGMVYEQERIQE